MADYPISIDAVRKMLIDLRNSLGNERYISIGITMALHQLDGFSQMDAVSVVRCRECKHSDSATTPEGKVYCVALDEYFPDDGFCHMGAKMDAKDMDVPTKDGGCDEKG